MNVRVVVAICLFLASTSVGCGPQVTPVGPSTEPAMASPAAEATATISAQKVSEGMDQRLIAANTAFGVDLFRQVVGKEGVENVFVSPTSVAMALAMAYNGARGETKEQMARVLGIDAMTLEQVNEAYAALRQSLASVERQVELSVANSIWARAGVGFYPDFLERCRVYYGAEATTLDFGDPSAAETINEWIGEQTRGRITEVVEPPIDPQTVMFLLNAIYFKGQWAIEFDASKTVQRPFHLADGSNKQVSMMSQSGDYMYLRGDGFQAVALPYGEGRIAAYVFVPDTDSDLGALLNALNEKVWSGWMSQFAQMEGDIALPRFRVEYEANLGHTLQAMGIKIAFDPDRADLSGMRPVPPDLFIQSVKHKTFVEVNEQGTEAAAVTSVEIGVTSIREKFELVADRPFLFAIRDQDTGSVLFLGTVVDPGA